MKARKIASSLGVLGLLAAVGPSVGCGGDCGDYEPAFPMTGTYSLVSDSDDPPAPEWQALEGAELEVDRGTGLFMLRYTRDGITYEVSFDYVAQVDAPI